MDNPLRGAFGSPEPRTSNPLVIPQDHLSLMPQRRQDALRQHREVASRSFSSASAVSAESTVSDFLEAKVQMFSSDVDYFRVYQDGLREALSADKLSTEEYQDTMEQLSKSYEPTLQQLQVLKRQRRTLQQDIEDSCHDTEPQPQKRPNLAREASIGFLERAYASTMEARVMGASKQQKRNFDQSKFRKDVIRYLGADKDPEGEGHVWCHLTGWSETTDVKAAHLVPKILRGHELTHLFGVGEVVLTDPRNGITLHKKIEEGLDRGIIVIVPIPPTVEHQDTRWKCVLVEQDRKKQTVLRLGDWVRWEDLDGKEVEFLTPNRPARRYLYFRFVISYIHAKRKGNTEWAEKVESKKVLWASPGQYLEKSTLCSLGRNISGFELPPPLYENYTFDADEPLDKDDELLLASRIREAAIESAKERLPEEEGDSEEESDSEEDED